MQRKQATTMFLLALMAAALYLCYIIVRPFLGPFFFAVMIAIVFHPIHAHIQERFHRQNMTAVISTLMVLLLLIVPTIWLAITVSKEITGLYQSLSKSSLGQGGWNAVVTHAMDRVLNWVGRYIDLSSFDLREALVQWLKEISRPLLSLGAHTVSNVFVFLANAVVTFFTLFFLFREGGSMRKRVASILPLDPSQEERLFTGISNSIVANVHGCFAVGVSQGLLGGLAYWVLGLPSPVLWAVVTGLFSMIPVIGSAAVWGPAAIILIFSGHWGKGLALLAWGIAIVGQVDNVVRPYVISQRSNMHPLLVFFSLLGGVKAFGVMGLFVGPVILSVTIVVFEMLRETNSEVSVS